MEKKYKTVPEGNMLRIIALKNFSDVKRGDRGGLIKKEENLSQIGDCWVFENAKVSGNARVCENAKIYGHAWVYGKALVRNDTWVYGDAKVYGEACVSGYAEIYGHARVFGDAWVHGHASVYENAKIYKKGCVSDTAKVYGSARVCGEVTICQEAEIGGNVKIWSTNMRNISISIKNSKDYVIILAAKDENRIFPSNIKNLIDKEDISIVEKDYIRNIQTIRQIYGKEI